MWFWKNRVLGRYINIDKVAFKEVNFKSKLLEWSQKNKVRMEYRMLKQKTDDNGSPIFSFQVVIEGIEGERGSGYSKKEAQQLASKETLQKLKREPQFVDAVFKAKSDRTKMEEEPTMLVPDPEKEQEDFLIRSQETVESSQENLEEISQPKKTPAMPEISEILSDDELDLSDITHKEKSREDIIAEAEAAAFAEA
jgi:ribonuclease-3